MVFMFIWRRWNPGPLSQCFQNWIWPVAMGYGVSYGRFPGFRILNPPSKKPVLDNRSKTTPIRKEVHPTLIFKPPSL